MIAQHNIQSANHLYLDHRRCSGVKRVRGGTSEITFLLRIYFKKKLLRIIIKYIQVYLEFKKISFHSFLPKYILQVSFISLHSILKFSFVPKIVL